MPLALFLKAELTGVTDLQPVDTQESPFYFTFKVQCTSCRETHPNWVSVSRFENNTMPNSRGESNFMYKCRTCSRTQSASITSPPLSYQHSSPATSQKLLEMDCRGLEFVEFRPEGEWSAKGLGKGGIFKVEIDEGGEWFDYDEKAGEEISITGCVWDIKRA